MTEPQRIEIPRLTAADVTPAPDWPDRLGESAEEVAERHARRTAARRRLWVTNRPARYAAATVADLDADQHPDRLAAWWGRADVATLVLRSDQPGPGKTHAAYAVGNDVVAADERVWAAAWSMVAFNEAMRPGRDETAYDVACSCDLLLLDDVGRERVTDWTQERFQGVLDARYAARLRTVITTNLSGQATQDRYGDPIVDRLRDDAWVLPFTGPSRRSPAPW